MGETPPEINLQSFNRSHINCLLEFQQSFTFGGFVNHQSFNKVYTNCSLEFQQSLTVTKRFWQATLVLPFKKIALLVDRIVFNFNVIERFSQKNYLL